MNRTHYILCVELDSTIHTTYPYSIFAVQEKDGFKFSKEEIVESYEDVESAVKGLRELREEEAKK
jgi:hypothetical protein